MAFAIVAEFPLGTYRGHRPDGALDEVPAPARLHAALLSAAASGVRAVERDGALHPAPADQAALEWLEAHPPDGLLLPPSLRTEPRAETFRSLGLWQKWTVRSIPRDAEGAVALDGRLAWIWDQNPPDEVRDALAALCPEVAFLGTTESPVVLRVGEATPSHRRDPKATLFRGIGTDLAIAQPGRTAALVAAYGKQLAAVRRAGDDAVKESGEEEQPPPVERAALATARYVVTALPDRAAAVAPPWETALVLPLAATVPPASRVAWAVALHRAVVALIGDGAPRFVTGRYAAGDPRPPNRLAIQYVTRELPLAFALTEPAAFVLLVPPDADAQERRTLDRALRQLTQLRLTQHRVVAIGGRAMQTLPATAFWNAPPADHRRVWVTVPAAIPESFPVRGRSWTLEDAVLLSVALLWRDALDGRGHGRDWYARLASRARAHGVRVAHAHRLHAQRLERFVHRLPSGMVIQPYEATLTLGDLAGERTVLAIGQSRHLGGGLLVPSDLPQPSGVTEE